jgi:hypothetical protein
VTFSSGSSNDPHRRSRAARQRSQIGRARVRSRTISNWRLITDYLVSQAKSLRFASKASGSGMPVRSDLLTELSTSRARVVTVRVTTFFPTRKVDGSGLSK